MRPGETESIRRITVGVTAVVLSCLGLPARGQEEPASRNPYPSTRPPSERPRSVAPESYSPPSSFLPPAGFRGGASGVDAYGNAQFDLPERREIGIFQTSAEWDALGAYQTLNRRQDSRGGTSFFSLPGDLLGLSTMGTLEGAASPSILADVTAEQRRAFLQYGGFGERRTPGLEDDITSAFSRRQRLISANAAYAPVYRAIMQNSSFAGLRPLVSATPFMESDTGAPLEAPVGGPSLYELLQSDTDTAHRRTAREAWTLFEEGEYRRAARTFESALTLEPGDAEVRIGEFMSYAAVGSIQTAAVLMRKFNEIEANPFAHDVRVRERFADVALVDGLLRDGRLAVDSAEAGRNPNLTATYVLLLWYLGEKDAAVRGARALAREAEAADYRDWPAKMDAARAALSSSTSR